MATEAEAHVGEANSINIVKYVGNIEVEDLGGLNATKAKEAVIDDVKNEETEQVKSSDLPIPNVVEIPENSKLESESATLVPDTEADVKEDKDQVDEGNAVELPNVFADSTFATEQELKSEATRESIFPEAAVEEMISTEEPSPAEVSENIPEFVSNEVATSDATAEEVKTTNTNNIGERTTFESFQDVPESAAQKEPCLLDAAVPEKENSDTLLTDSSQAEEITENVPEPSPTETGEDTQVTDSTAIDEVQKNNPESFVSTTENKETLIAEPSKTLVVTETVLETAVLETPVEVPKVSKESSVSVRNADTTVEASEVISKVSGDAKKVEEKKENSLGKLFMQENEVVAEEQKTTTDENTSLVEGSRDHLDDMGNHKTGEEVEETGESRELLKAEVKSSNQKSNIFTKMKQSIVKAKKAIVGKSPSSKAMEVESRNDIKP